MDVTEIEAAVFAMKKTGHTWMETKHSDEFENYLRGRGHNYYVGETFRIANSEELTFTKFHGGES